MFVDQSELLAATHGGLDIITHYYPQVQQALQSSRKEFKIRDEKTPSARIKQLADGNWVVTDWGDDSVSRNGIQICMKAENLTYREAMVTLGSRYGVGTIKKELHKPELTYRDATPQEPEGEYYFDVKQKLEEWELLELGPRVTEEVCRRYSVHSLNSFTQIKDRKAIVTAATEHYPIYLIDHGDWKKIYQPRNPEKKYRFRHTGTRPKDHVNGLDQVRKAYQNELDKAGSAEDRTDEDGELKPVKLKEIIICSGERDALNVAGMGYQVIWLNSETAEFKEELYKELAKYCEILYNLPDIDKTGIDRGILLGMKYLDIHTIWLPDKLRTYNDARGKPRKDLRDFVEIYPKNESFYDLLKVAVPMRFWDEFYEQKKLKYYFNNYHALYFLRCNGFYIIEDKNSADDYALIRIIKNRVHEIKPKDIKAFFSQFLAERYMPIPLRNMVLKTNQLSDGSLANLPEAKLDFTDFDRTSQFFFFNNETWQVTAAEIHSFKPDQVSQYVWNKEVMLHDVNLLTPPFTITFNKDSNDYDITINDYSSPFLRFLINTSRTHWKVELEDRLDKTEEEYKVEYLDKNRWRLDGELLTQQEIWEQKQHLINKIFSIGYLLYRFKDPARAWCVFAMDNKSDEDGMSNGRSGKSLCYKILRKFMSSVTLPGRDKGLTENKHIYDRVTVHTDYILIDDASQYFDFGFFFDAVTGDINVNPKNNKSYEIPFEQAPKFCITSNFTLRKIDPSTEGRILYTVFSDYYHYQMEQSEYRESRTVNDDFKKNLFSDYTVDEWNFDLNLFAQCVRFFLQVPSPMKINPPMDMVTKRNLRTAVGEEFLNWASVYFSKESGNTDKLIIKKDAFEDFQKSTGSYKGTINKFTASLKAWCRYESPRIWSLDPKSLQNEQGRIIRKEDGKAVEKIYIQTKPLAPEDIANHADPDEPMAPDPEDRF